MSAKRYKRFNAKTQKKLNNINAKSYKKLFLIIALLMLCIIVISSNSTQIITNVKNKIYRADIKQSSFTAYLYDSSSNSGTATELTVDNTDTKEMNRGNQLLTISWTYNADDMHTLDITVPTGMYIVANSWTTDETYFDKSEFTKLTGLSGSGKQGTGSYANDYTGTLHYETNVEEYLNPTVTISMYVAFDENIWSKTKSNHSLTGDETAITIVADESTNVELKKSLKEVTTSQTAIATYNSITTSGYFKDTKISNSDEYQRIARFGIQTDGTKCNFILDKKISTVTITVIGSDGSKKDVEVPYKFYGAIGKEVTKSEDGTFEETDIILTNIQALPGYVDLLITDDLGLEDGDKIKVNVVAQIYPYIGDSYTSNATVTYTYVKDAIKIEAVGSNLNVPAESWYGDNTDEIDTLGCISFGNAGVEGKEDVEVEYVFDSEYSVGDTLNIKVRELTLPIAFDDEKEITVTLVNEQGETKEATILSTETQKGRCGYTVAVSDLIDEDGYYIWKVNFKMDVESRTYYYEPSRQQWRGRGTYRGRATGNKARITNIITIKYDDAEIKGQNYTNVVSNNTITNDIYLSAPSASSTLECYNGETMDAYFAIKVTDYSYGRSYYAPNPVIYFIAPKGIEIDKVLSSKISYDGDEKEFEVVRTTDDGDKVYKITLGYSIGRLPSLTGGYFHLFLNVSEDSEKGSYNLRDRIFVTNENEDGTLTNTGLGGSYAPYTNTDVFDADNDGNITEKFATYPNNSNNYLNVKVRTQPLAVPTDSIIQYDGKEHQLGYITTNGGEVTYSLTEDGEYTTEPFYGTEIGDYTIYYKVAQTDETYYVSGSYVASINITRTITLEKDNPTTEGTAALYYLQARTRTLDGVKTYYYEDYNCLKPLKDGYIMTVPTKDGYTFNGYFSEKDGQGTKYIDTDGKVDLSLYTRKEDFTLYANWTAHTYTLKYDANGGSGDAIEEQSFTYDESQNLKENTFSKDYYNFLGWSTDKTATEATYTDKQEVKNLTPDDKGTVTLYAVWEPVEYAIAYDLAGGKVESGKENPTQYNIESEDITLNNPTKDGYTFEGWSGSDITGKSTNVTIAKGSHGDKSYTANWKTITYSITYDLAGGKLESENENPTEYNIESADITLNNPTKDGYTFKGWKEGDSSEETETAEETVTISTGSIGNKKYTATWEANGDTKYVVKHWKQNKNSNADTHDEKNYTLSDTEELAGETDTQVTPPTKTYDGYVAPEGTSATIKGDGSLVINYYYKLRSDIKYTIHYYFDSVEDTAKKEEKTATYLEEISKYTDYSSDRYLLKEAVVLADGELPLEIGTDEDKNIINVYYYSVYKVYGGVSYHDEELDDGTVIQNVQGGTIKAVVANGNSTNGNGVSGNNSNDNGLNTNGNSANSANENIASGKKSAPRRAKSTSYTIYETINYGEESIKDIIFTPDSGYKLISVKINKAEYVFGESDLASDGSLTIEAGYFTNVTEDKYIEATFKKEVSMTVKYKDEETNEEIADAATIDGYDGKEYSIARKAIANFITSEKGLTKEDGQTTAEEKGSMIADDTVLIYWYKRAEAQDVVVKHIEKNEKGEYTQLDEETTSTKSGYTVDTARKTYDGYIAVAGQASGDENVTVASAAQNSITVTASDSAAKEVWYYYEKQFTLDMSISGEGGSISNSGETILNRGNSTKEYVITPNNGYKISTIKVNGEEVSFSENDDHSYTIPAGYFEDVQENKNIVVTFEKISSKVTVSYIDETTGENLATEVVIEGFVNDEYEIEEKAIEGYEISSTSQNLKGQMTEKPIVVTIKYKKKETKEDDKKDETDKPKEDDDSGKTDGTDEKEKKPQVKGETEEPESKEDKDDNKDSEKKKVNTDESQIVKTGEKTLWYVAILLVLAIATKKASKRVVAVKSSKKNKNKNRNTNKKYNDSALKIAREEIKENIAKHRAKRKKKYSYKNGKHTYKWQI